MKRYPVLSWSVGKVTSGEACPKMYEGKYILKLAEKKSPAAARGNRIHREAEYFLGGKRATLPESLSKLANAYRRLKKANPLVEQKIAVDRQWRLTTWSKGYLRCIFDAFHIEIPKASVVDHKSGRLYPEHNNQAEVYACIAVAADEVIEEVEVDFYYVDKGLIRPWKFNRNQVLDMRQSWDERAKRILTMKRFPATPSETACRWCPRRSDKGGDCKEWRRV